MFSTTLLFFFRYFIFKTKYKMEIVNYNNKNFRPVSNSENGETSAETIFKYQQTGDILTSEYSGGDIVKGHLIGLVNREGVMEMSYHQINHCGELRTGRCTSVPEILKMARSRSMRLGNGHLAINLREFRF